MTPVAAQRAKVSEQSSGSIGAYPVAIGAARLLMGAVAAALGRLPPSKRDAMAAMVGDVAYAVWTTRRPILAANLAVVLGCEPDDTRVRRCAREVLRNFARMSVEFLALRAMTPEQVWKAVMPRGEQYLAECLSKGRGVILTLPHIGNWDIAAAFAPRYGLPITILTEGNWTAELVAGSRLVRGVRLLPRNRSLRPLFRALMANEGVVILGDIAVPDLSSAQVPFFGRPASFPIGPARLSVRTGAPILVVGSTRVGDGRFLVEAQPPLWPNEGLPELEAAHRLTAEMAAGFERIVASFPDQWYAFHRVWDDVPARSPSRKGNGAAPRRA